MKKVAENHKCLGNVKVNWLSGNFGSYRFTNTSDKMEQMNVLWQIPSKSTEECTEDAFHPTPIQFLFRTSHCRKNRSNQVNGRFKHKHRYAYETVLVAINSPDLQKLLTAVENERFQIGLRLNFEKAKWFVIRKSQEQIDTVLRERKIFREDLRNTKT